MEGGAARAAPRGSYQLNARRGYEISLRNAANRLAASSLRSFFAASARCRRDLMIGVFATAISMICPLTIWRRSSVFILAPQKVSIRYRHLHKKPCRMDRQGFSSFKSLAVTYSCMPEGHTTIGAQRFHFRVRNGIGWFPPAIAARQTGSASTKGPAPSHRNSKVVRRTRRI
jgi:hypothetical protein